MQIIEQKTDSHELVLWGVEPESGYRGIIAIHDSTLGAAIGGARFWNYAGDEEALVDALRLARGMTYKNALAGLPFGGGKSIIIGDNQTTERERIFRAHGRFVETLGGRYITAEDIGSSPADMEHVSAETSHVAGLLDKSGDPSPITARGVFRAIQAAAKFRWGTDELAGKRVALQGCGHVGFNLATQLCRAGARLIATDVNEESLRRVVAEHGAEPVALAEIYGVAADIFAPCALGGILNDETIPRLKAEIVAGAANNQLLEARHGAALERRGITYAPDYVANAGGVINGCIELLDWQPAQALKKVDEIYNTVLDILRAARAAGIPAHVAADRRAEARLRATRNDRSGAENSEDV